MANALVTQTNALDEHVSPVRVLSGLRLQDAISHSVRVDLLPGGRWSCTSEIVGSDFFPLPGRRISNTVTLTLQTLPSLLPSDSGPECLSKPAWLGVSYR